MRIVIDMQGAQTESRFRGIGRYSLSFAQAVVRARGEHEVVLLLNGQLTSSIEPIRAAFHDLLPQRNIHVWFAPGPVHVGDRSNAARRQAALMVWEAYLCALQPDVVHLTSLFEGYHDDAVVRVPVVDELAHVTVSLYDLIPLLNPVHYFVDKYFEIFYRQQLGGLQYATRCLAISFLTRKEAIDHLKLPCERVVNVSAGVGDGFHPITIENQEAQKLFHRFEVAGPFLLYSGGADERKNLGRLVEALAQIRQIQLPSCQLLIVGRMPPVQLETIRQRMTDLMLPETAVSFLGYVDEATLLQLYSLCDVYVFPSWYEGFGLPVLEAMACGAPVVCANTSSLPEVAGDAAVYFNPFDVREMASQIALVLLDDDLRTRLRQAGRERANLFKWEAVASSAWIEWSNLVADAPIAPAREHCTQVQLMHDLAALVAENCTVNRVGLAAVASFIPWEQRRPIWYIDVSELIHRDARSGVQRVTRSIVWELLKNSPTGASIQPVYAHINQPGYFNALVSHETGELLPQTTSLQRIEWRAGDVFLGLDLQHHITRAQRPELDLMRTCGVCVLFVVYDLLPIWFPEFWPDGHGMRCQHEEWLEEVARYDGAICISDAVAQELRSWLDSRDISRLRPFSIQWFHLGADIENSLPSQGLPDDASVVLRQLGSRRTFLAVGTLEPRKGLGQILSAIELLWGQGIEINLVLVGKQGWLVDDLCQRLAIHPELGCRLHWLQGISDEYLDQIYCASTCLIAASYGEGFGLPLIEAAAHSLPIIARDIPVFREVAGAGATYFVGSQPNELADAVLKWLAQYQRDAHPKSDGIKRLTWAESRAQLVHCIERLT